MRICIIKPILEKFNLSILFSEFNFFLLVLATVFIAAAGNLINDYFDAEHDKDSEKTNHIDNGISKNFAFNIYIALNIIAVAIGFYLSSLIGMYKIGIIFILIAGLLWFYSTSFKRSFLLGNFIIAIFAALVPLVILPYEILLQYQIHKSTLLSTGNNLSEITSWILAYSAFAFLLTFIREIIKDIEDYDVDIKHNYNTLPIIAGIKTSKYIVAGFIFSLIILLSFVIFKFLNITIFQYVYSIILVIIPLIYIGIFILKANEQKNYRFLSLLMKITMFTGVLFAYSLFL